MFVKAIEEIQKFTRPVHTILRYYQQDFILPGAGTLFFINEDAVAVTCKHIVQLLVQEQNINYHYSQFKADKKSIGVVAGPELQALETQYKYDHPTAIAAFRSSLLNCTDSGRYDYFLHPTLDLAIIQFKDVKQRYYSGYARFIKDDEEVKQGKTLCRYGFPFAEFTNFAYDAAADELNFTKSGLINSPSFPMDGIVTRHVADATGIVGLELSTPGLRGQSGGPLFDTEGAVYGMQSQTFAYHMGFDEQKAEIVSYGKRLSTVNHSFLNVVRCVHANAIKSFLKEKGFRYYEKD